MTRVDAVSAGVYTLPTEQPESDGTLTWDHTTVVTAHVSAAGVSGLGFTYGPAACATVIRDLLADVVFGADAMNISATWEAMVRATRNAGRPGVVSMAIAAMDVALWDLKARLLNLPLVTLLGACREAIPVYGSGGFTSLPIDELRAQLAGWAHGDGMRCVKMKVGTEWGSDPDRDLRRVAAARDAIGADTELFVDANGAYTRKQGVRLGRAFEGVGVTWFEEPVSSDDLEGLHEIRGMVGCDVAAGEYGYDLAYFARLCAAGAVDVVQCDVSRCGGITEWLRVAALAAGHGLDISGHCAQSLHAHVACAVPNARHTEYFADHARVDRLLFDGVLDPQKGALAPDTTRIGHGLTLTAVADHVAVA
jgi:L-alanine-DL-glutamate epimerase-like enolase superfamily enzyme